MSYLRKFIALCQERRAEAPKLSVVDRSGDLPTLMHLEQFFVRWKTRPTSPLFNGPRAMHFRGPLRVDLLERVLTEVVQEHEILRCVFTETSRGVMHRILPASGSPLSHVDLSHVPQGGRRAEAERLVQELYRAPMDMTTGPLFKPTLFRLSDDEHILCLATSLMVTDGWATDVLVAELAARYNALVEGREHQAEKQPFQYVDVAHAYRRWLEGPAGETQRRFWQEKFRNPPPLLSLPADRARPEKETFRLGVAKRTLSDAVMRQVRARAERDGQTMLFSLMSAYMLLLARYSDQTGIAVGVPIAGRERTELRKLLGCIMRSPSICADLSGNPTLAELGDRVSEAMIESSRHQDYPLELAIGLPLAAQLTFRIRLNYVPMSAPPTFAQLEGSRMPIDLGMIGFDVLLIVTDEPDRISLMLNYKRDLFSPERVDCMLAHYEQLLATLASASLDTRMDALVADIHPPAAAARTA